MFKFCLSIVSFEIKLACFSIFSDNNDNDNVIIYKLREEERDYNRWRRRDKEGTGFSKSKFRKRALYAFNIEEIINARKEDQVSSNCPSLLKNL